MKKVSVVLPVYNEERYIEGIFNSVLDFSKKNPSYEFIFVNDGSTDNTKEILKNKTKSSKTKNIRLISNNPNQGKGYAIKKGVEQANGNYICFTDGDLAYSLDHIPILVKKLKDSDVVIGSRGLVSENVNNVTTLRRIFGVVFNLLTRAILSLNYNDMQAGIKGFRKQVAKELFSKQKLKGFSFDVEILYSASKKHYSISEAPARLSKAHMHQASNVNLLKDSTKMFFNLFKIRMGG